MSNEIETDYIYIVTQTIHYDYQGSDSITLGAFTYYEKAEEELIQLLNKILPDNYYKSFLSDRIVCYTRLSNPKYTRSGDGEYFSIERCYKNVLCFEHLKN